MQEGIPPAIEFALYLAPFAIVIFIESNKKADKKLAIDTKKKKIDGIINSEQNNDNKLFFNPELTKECFSYNNENFAISINVLEKKLFIALDERHIYNFENIINVEIEIDGNSVASPSLGGAIAGGLLFGGAGAIVGSSAKTINKQIKDICLKIFIDDLNNPYHRLVFFTSETFIPSNHESISVPQKNINEWYARLLNIIDKNKSSSTTEPNTPSISIADEILKLSKLLKNGHISKEDYDNLKTSLINRQ